LDDVCQKREKKEEGELMHHERRVSQKFEKF
jgi:hypothetical protein